MAAAVSQALLFLLIFPTASALDASRLQVSSPDYCYTEEWCDSYAWQVTFKYCIANFMDAQSPVNLDPEFMWRNLSMPPLELHGYEEQQTDLWIMKNIRDTVAVEFNPGMRLSGGNFPKEYDAFYMAFHWGNEVLPGSEHTYNDRRFPMEMQIFHLVPPYQSVLQAAYRERSAVAILSVFIDIGPKDNPIFEKISSLVPYVPTPGDELYIYPFPLRDLLPNDTSKFYRYPGSLTFPDCLFAIEWAVFEEPIYIGYKQYIRFVTSLFRHDIEEGEEPHLLTMNYRHVHALFYRHLEVSPNASIPMPSTAHRLAPTHTHTPLLLALGALLLLTIT